MSPCKQTNLPSLSPPCNKQTVGAPVALSTFVTANLIPVTLGNTLGGALVALAYAYCYGSLGKPKAAAKAAAA